MRLRSWSTWTTRERWVTCVIVLVAAAVVMSQLLENGSIESTLTYVGFTLVMVGLVLSVSALFRASSPRRADSGSGTAQKVMLAAGVLVLAWAAVSTARMEGGFVLAAFVAQVAIGLVYVTIAGLGAVAISRTRNK